MQSYITVFRALTPEQLSPLTTLVESLLGWCRTIGITIRNVAAVPQTGHLYVYAEAPAMFLVVRLFRACGLSPVSIVEADTAKWGRLIRSATSATSATSTLAGNHWNRAEDVGETLWSVPAPMGLVPVPVRATGGAPARSARGRSAAG